MLCLERRNTNKYVKVSTCFVILSIKIHLKVLYMDKSGCVGGLCEYLIECEFLATYLRLFVRVRKLLSISGFIRVAIMNVCEFC